MLETDEKWTNEYLTETLSRNSEIKIETELEKNQEKNFGKFGNGIDLGKGYYWSCVQPTCRSSSSNKRVSFAIQTKGQLILRYVTYGM